MPIFAVTCRYSDDIHAHVGSPNVIQRLWDSIREICPTWEEWQVVVDLHPVADQQ
jgi:hypothetical protein